jgi:hypothetical protein
VGRETAPSFFKGGTMANKLGMLWFDNNPKKDLEAKLKDAGSYYQMKYGSKPTQAIIGRAAFESLQIDKGTKEDVVNLDGFTVIGKPYILPNHIHIS